MEGLNNESLSSSETVEKKESVKITEQEARAELRERFLRLFVRLQGKSCEFRTIENTTVKGIFQMCHPNLEQICIKQLETPLSTYERAILRGTDFVSITTYLDK